MNNVSYNADQNVNNIPGPTRGLQQSVVGGSAGGSFTEHFQGNPYALNLEVQPGNNLITTYDARQSLNDFKGVSFSEIPKASFVVPLEQIEASLLPTNPTPINDNFITQLASAEEETTPKERQRKKKSIKKCGFDAEDIIPCVGTTVAGVGYDIYYWNELPKDIVGGKSFHKKFKYVFCRDKRPFYLTFLVLALLCVVAIITIFRNRVTRNTRQVSYYRNN